MAFQPTTSISAYVDQYVKIATNGNVNVSYAQLVDRMQLGCKVCQQTLTCPLPSSDAEMDWATQEFVKLHRHIAVQPLTTGEGTPTQITWSSPEGTIPKKNYTTFSKPKAVTADFKPVKKDDWGISTGRKFR